METQIAVLGAGPGGYAAAFLAADLGMQVTLIDAEARLGGECLLRGCIPSKALLHVAKVISDAEHAGDWGLTFTRPKIDLETMRGRKEKVISTLAGGLKQIAGRRGVTVIRARGKFHDSNTLTLEAVGDSKLEHKSVSFEQCIVATGSSPGRIPAWNNDSPRIMDSAAALELPDIPETMLVVGGGAIGLEMGTVYAGLGSQVDLVEVTDGLIPGADRDLVKPLHKRLESLFRTLYLRTKVVQLTADESGVEVTFEGDLKEKVQRYDRVLVSVGRKPNSAKLGLEQTRVKLDERGFIQVNEKQQTADENIYAIGDVCGNPMLAHRAMHQGKVAVEVIEGQPAIFDPRAIPAVVYTDPEVAWAGLTQTEAEQEGRQVEAALYPWAASGRAQAVGRTEGLTKLIFDPQTQIVLGVGLVGIGAGDLISEAVLAIEMGANALDFAGTIHPHPTLSETVSGAAEVQLGTATELYKPKRSRRSS